MRSLLWLVALSLAGSGCVLVFDGDDGGDDTMCGGEGPPIASLELRDPGDLVCRAFGQPCDSRCGPCPAATADLAPIPTWGVCGSTCEGLAENECARSPECRVIKDAACGLTHTCLVDFLGCFPVDTATEPNVNCFAARDGWSCSRSSACTAFHRNDASGPNDPREFAMCAPEGRSPGLCAGPVLCDGPAPSCPAGTTPGIADNCYTGACIPLDLCPPNS
ncbi:MAG: hypothetical protein ACTHU0_30210 [Kofleriaceae bacterium]